MARSTRDIKKSTKKRNPRGRPRTGIGEGVLVRLNKEQLARVDDWIAENLAETNKRLSRPAAIRIMIDACTRAAS
jgi:hypothetical protein